MSVNSIDAKMLAKMFLAGAKRLESKKDYINELNVFPVPDGDTGTNMTLTIMSAAKDVDNLEDADMATLCKAMSSGSLRGARGNSGVILSQLLRGFTKVVKEYDTLDVAIVSAGFEKAVESAYKAVMKPKEGTILTVAKGVCDKATELFENGQEDAAVFFKEVIDYGYEVLAKTPDMLPVLKEAGVVDSGGQGLMEFLSGAYDALMGNEISFSMDEQTAAKASETRMLSGEAQKPVETKYGYKTSLIILPAKVFNVKSESDLKAFIDGIGEDGHVEVVGDGAKVLVAVNTNDPGIVIQKGLKYGQIADVIIDNLRLNKDENASQIPMNQDNTSLDEATKDEDIAKEAVCEHKDTGFIAVSVGDGIGNIFKDLGADYIIEGGQTMNPSTEDMLNAINKVNADTIYILPNNKNIIMAANQARDLTEDKTIVVIPTKNVPQGIAALIGYVPSTSIEEVEANMLEAISLVKTGQITYAVRDTVIEGVEIHQDDYMGIGDLGILSNGKDIEDVTIKMLDKMIDEDSELVSIYYGADIDEEAAKAIKDKIEAKFADVEVELQNGGQPIYYYIISVE